MKLMTLLVMTSAIGCATTSASRMSGRAPSVASAKLNGLEGKVLLTAIAAFQRDAVSDLKRYPSPFAECLSHLEAYDLTIAERPSDFVVTLAPNDRCNAQLGTSLSGGARFYVVDRDGEQVIRSGGQG